MKRFELFFNHHGLKVIKVTKERNEITNIVTVETEEQPIVLKIMKRLEIMKGLDGHIYRLEGIDVVNINGEIRLHYQYCDLNDKIYSNP